jgi:hypothetical protein
VPIVVTFTVPDGWQSRDIEVIRDPVVSIAFALVGNVYADPCEHPLKDPPIGPSVDDLAAALSQLPGVDATTPASVTFSGYRGKYLEFSVREDIACRSGDFRYWEDPPNAHSPGATPLGPPYFWAERRQNRIWILDIDSVRYVIDALTSPNATAADLAELQAVIDSIRIEPKTVP